MQLKLKHLLEDSLWRVRELSWRLSKRNLVVLYTLTVGLAILALLGLVLLLSGGGSKKATVDPQAAARATLAQVALGLKSNLEGTVQTLPQGVVRKLSDPKTLSGTIAERATDGTCLGFYLQVGKDYITSGDQGAVSTSVIQAFQQDACQAALPASNVDGLEGSSTPVAASTPPQVSPTP